MPPRLLRDHRVGGGEDRLGGAVVLLELDHARVGEVLLEVEDVAHVGAPEAVDRLAVVAHDRQVAVALQAHPTTVRGGLAAAADEQLQEPVLRVVGVLVLVHEHVAEGVGVALAHLLEQLHHAHGAKQQVVEVHRVHAVQLALVALVHVGHGLLEVVADPLAVRRRVAQLVLGGADLAVDGGAA